MKEKLNRQTTAEELAKTLRDLDIEPYEEKEHYLAIRKLEQLKDTLLSLTEVNCTEIEQVLVEEARRIIGLYWENQRNFYPEYLPLAQTPSEALHNSAKLHSHKMSLPDN